MKSMHKVITSALLLGHVGSYGCDPVEDQAALEAAENEQVQSVEPNEQNIIVVVEEFTEDPELAQELDLAAAPKVSEGPAGKCCYAECYDGIDAWYQLWWISADCNGKAAAWCASHNWGLKNAEWFYC